jgi:hypothetical protein
LSGGGGDQIDWRKLEAGRDPAVEDLGHGQRYSGPAGDPCRRRKQQDESPAPRATEEARFRHGGGATSRRAGLRSVTRGSWRPVGRQGWQAAWEAGLTSALDLCGARAGALFLDAVLSLSYMEALVFPFFLLPVCT